MKYYNKNGEIKDSILVVGLDNMTIKFNNLKDKLTKFTNILEKNISRDRIATTKHVKDQAIKRLIAHSVAKEEILKRNTTTIDSIYSPISLTELTKIENINPTVEDNKIHIDKSNCIKSIELDYKFHKANMKYINSSTNEEDGITIDIDEDFDLSILNNLE